MDEPNFARLLRGVCEREAWALVPNGVELEFPNGRRQVVDVETFEFDGEDFVRLRTIIGDAENLGAARFESALRVNANLAHGALALRDDELVMVDTRMLRGVGEAELAAAFRYLAETADRYERVLFGTDEH